MLLCKGEPGPFKFTPFVGFGIHFASPFQNKNYCLFLCISFIFLCEQFSISCLLSLPDIAWLSCLVVQPWWNNTTLGCEGVRGLRVDLFMRMMLHAGNYPL